MGLPGRPDQVRMGRLFARGLPKADVEEFYSNGLLIQAIPQTQPNVALTSIIIVTCNQVEYTQQCVESVMRITDEPYELIFVDNGSTDATIKYLESVGGARAIIRNEANRGFPAAVNQGIAAATGEQVLLLNNDTIVTTGWLGRMIATLKARSKDRARRPMFKLRRQRAASRRQLRQPGGIGRLRSGSSASLMTPRSKTPSASSDSAC